jgi:predicted O-linked N-acetylglucosamine transferase (SPINDLY family)
MLLRSSLPSDDFLRLHARNFQVEHQLVFVDRANTFATLAKGADVLLDTTLFGSHTSEWACGECLNHTAQHLRPDFIFPITRALGALDALWSALPVITCVGKCDESVDSSNQLSSRTVASMLYQLDLHGELVVHSLAEYRQRMYARS